MKTHVLILLAINVHYKHTRYCVCCY